MDDHFQKLDRLIQDQLRLIRSSAGLPDTRESLEKLAAAWSVKESAFDEQIRALGMENLTELNDRKRGFLALTASGSLIAVGPGAKGGRKSLYVSIDQRKNVPSRAESDKTALQDVPAVGRDIVFKRGPVRRSSAVYRLAAVNQSLAEEAQNRQLEEAADNLTRQFTAAGPAADAGR